MTNFWQDKTVLVTGAHGFVGQHLVKQLKDLKPKRLITPTSKELDFRVRANCEKAVKNVDVVIHLAAKVGGIGYNQEIPGEMLYDNLVMGVELMEAARKEGVAKFVTLGTVCAYPKFTTVPFSEEDLWAGYPEETNAPYGLAKKMLLVQGQAYRAQYGFNSIYLLPTNMYGPGDDFNPRTSHVIPALVKKFVEAKEASSETVEVWGTGKASREFLYVEDAVDGILLAAEKYNGNEPINLGSQFEITIKDLVKIIKKETGFVGKVVWDKSKPDGQPRRKLNTSKAQKEFGFVASTTFEQGLRHTIDWYLGQRKF